MVRILQSFYMKEDTGTDVGQTPEGAVNTPSDASCTLTELRVSEV